MLKRVHLVLDTERDADLLAWLAKQENRSAAIREAVRTALRVESRPQPELDVHTLRRVLRRVLREELRQVTVAAAGKSEPPGQADADPDAAARLDALF